MQLISDPAPVIADHFRTLRRHTRDGLIKGLPIRGPGHLAFGRQRDSGQIRPIRYGDTVIEHVLQLLIARLLGIHANPIHLRINAFRQLYGQHLENQRHFMNGKLIFERGEIQSQRILARFQAVAVENQP